MINRNKLGSVVEAADLAEYPGNIEPNPSDQVTIGDLHGNALKFMYFLIREGVLQLEEVDYLAFFVIYLNSVAEEPIDYDNDDFPESPALTPKNFSAFNEIINKASITPKAIANADFVVRLIGDELADRGANDYFTLKIFEKLKKGGVRVETLFSNHGVKFIEAMESEGSIADFRSKSMDKYGQINSLKALQQLIKDQLITEEAVKALYKNNYQLCFKAISYSIKGNQITLYTHAPVGLEIIEEITKKLNIPYDDSSAEKLAETIDKINDKFQEHVQTGRVKELYNLNEEDPFYLLMWHRTADDHKAKRPKHHNGYQINFVHGHDGSAGYKAEGEHEDHIVNLNNELGKFDDMLPGKYAVIKVSGSTQLTAAENLDEQDHGNLSTDGAPSLSSLEAKSDTQQAFFKDLLSLDAQDHSNSPTGDAFFEAKSDNQQDPYGLQSLMHPSGGESEPPEIARPPLPKIALEVNPQSAKEAEEPNAPSQKEWFKVYDKDKTSYCILESSSSADLLCKKIDELKANLNNSTKPPDKGQENITNANFSQDQTRISHHPLYVDNNPSTIQAYGLVEEKNSDNSLSSQLHLSEEVDLFLKDNNGNKTVINHLEFIRLLIVIDQQIKNGIKACGGDPKDRKDITLTLTIQNTSHLNIYEKAYLFYCKQAGYNCECIDGRNENQTIKTPDIMDDKALKESTCVNITLDTIQQHSKQQDEFLNKTPSANPNVTPHNFKP